MPLSSQLLTYFCINILKLHLRHRPQQPTYSCIHRPSHIFPHPQTTPHLVHRPIPIAARPPSYPSGSGHRSLRHHTVSPENTGVGGLARRKVRTAHIGSCLALEKSTRIDGKIDLKRDKSDFFVIVKRFCNVRVLENFWKFVLTRRMRCCSCWGDLIRTYIRDCGGVGSVEEKIEKISWYRWVFTGYLWKINRINWNLKSMLLKK